MAMIAQGMRRMLQGVELRSALAQAGRERALKEFHLEAVAKKYESVLENARQEQTS
jgi:glycosyltransferase involved in cell wall biosynthesis